MRRTRASTVDRSCLRSYVHVAPRFRKNAYFPSLAYVREITARAPANGTAGPTPARRLDKTK